LGSSAREAGLGRSVWMQAAQKRGIENPIRDNAGRVTGRPGYLERIILENSRGMWGKSGPSTLVRAGESRDS